MARRSELAVQHHVAVEDRAGRVGDRLVVVVALHQHRVEAGDREGRDLHHRVDLEQGRQDDDEVGVGDVPPFGGLQ